jgi:hypothetical protein
MKGLNALPPLRVFFRDVLGLDTCTRAGILAFFGALDGTPLDADAAALFETFTQRPYVHRPGGYPQGVLQVGRQAGKSEGAAARLVYGATGAVLSGKRNRVYIGIAQDHRAGRRALLGHVKKFADAPLVRPLIGKVIADTVEFAGNNVIHILPCRPAAVRGLEVDEAVLDELAFYLSTDNIPRDRDVWRAVLPALAMTGGRLIALSSPHAAAGLLYQLHRQHYGVDASDLLFWQAASTAMNPKLSDKFVQHLRDVDAESAEAEVDAQFLRNVSTLFDPGSLDACVDHGVVQRRYQPGTTCRSFCDAASGTGQDAFTAAIAHGENEHAVLDAVITIRPPFSPESAIRQIAALLREYHVREIHGDRYAPNFVAEAFARQHITYRRSEKDRTAIYLDLLSRVNAGAVRLLDNADLLRELRGLERHRASTKDRVDHRRGAHDDTSNSAAGALVLASAARQPLQVLYFDGGNTYRALPSRRGADPLAHLPQDMRADPSWRRFIDLHGPNAALERWTAMRNGTYRANASQPSSTGGN